MNHLHQRGLRCLGYRAAHLYLSLVDLRHHLLLLSRLNPLRRLLLLVL